MARLAAVVCLAVVALGAARWIAPPLTRERDVVAATPSLTGLFSVIDLPLRSDQRACVSPVAFDRSTRRARFLISSTSRGGSSLAVEARGAGWIGRGAVASYVPKRTVAAEAVLSPPPPRSLDGSLCILNEGPGTVNLVSTGELRSLVLAETRVDGRLKADQDLALTLLEERPASMLSRMGAVLGHASDFTGGFVPMWLLWPLTVLFVVGVPCGIAAALALGLRGTPADVGIRSP
jgi:hypothetical protein